MTDVIETGEVKQTPGASAAPPARRLDPSVALTLVALGAGVALLLYLGRGLWFFTDEWNFLLNRRELTLYHVMRPHNEHWVAFPALLYRGLLALGGLHTYWPYYLTGVAFHTAATVAGWAVLRRLGVPHLVAAPAALSLLLMGAASEQLFNAFQLGWTAPIALFCGALLLLERPVPRARHVTGASACLALAMPFGGVGLALAVGMAAGLVLRRRFRTAVLVAGPALACYLLWRLVWGVSPPLEPQAFPLIPAYVAYGVTASVAGFTGLPLVLAAALLAVLAVWLVVAALRTPLPLTAWAASCSLLAFFASAGLARALASGVRQAGSSRYLYLGVLLLLLATAAASRPLWRSRTAVLVAAGLVAACLVVNVVTLRDEARAVRALKGASAMRILAADALLTQGIPHVPQAQPDPLYAPDVTAQELHELRQDGLRLDYQGPAEPSDLITREERLRLQVALTAPPEKPTADVRLVAGQADVVPSGEGCADLRVLSGTTLELAASAGSLRVDPLADTVVHIRRTGGEDEFFQIGLYEDDERGVELAVPAQEGEGGTLSLSFPVDGALELCARDLRDARSAS